MTGFIDKLRTALYLAMLRPTIPATAIGSAQIRCLNRNIERPW
jgi:hypothetical protein